MSTISNVKAIKILDSRGNWTVEARVELADGSFGAASVPAGASVGKYEARVANTEDAVKNINENVGRKIIGFEAGDQAGFDRLLIAMDGTRDKSKLGANLILVLSEAVCEASARSKKIPLYKYIDSIFEPQSDNFLLPTPLFNLINGGKHARNGLDFQEFIFVPPVSATFKSKLEWAVSIYHNLEETLQLKGLSTGVGDEGGFSPNNLNDEAALRLLTSTVNAYGRMAGQSFSIGLDAAADTFYKNSLYNLRNFNPNLSPLEILAIYGRFLNQYPITYLEDPFAEDDWEGWIKLTASHAGRVEIAGDDLIATNIARLEKAIALNAITAVIIKPNQIGTVSESLAVVERAKKAGLNIVVSHRSGETDSTFIADFAVGVGAKYIKAGAPARGERIAKYDRLLEIEAGLTV